MQVLNIQIFHTIQCSVQYYTCSAYNLVTLLLYVVITILFIMYGKISLLYYNIQFSFFHALDSVLHF